MVQPQPQKFALEVKCRCRGCRDRYAKENTIPKFQRLLAALYGLQHSSYNEMNGTLEIIGEVDNNKLEELKRLFYKHTSKKNSPSWCCFWPFWASSKNKECAAYNAPLHNARPLTHYANNNSNNDNNRRTKDAKTQTGDDVDRRREKEERKQEKCLVDARDKGKGKMGEGSCSEQGKGKGIKLGDGQRAKGVEIKSEGDQRGEVPPRCRDQRGTNVQGVPQTNVMILNGYVVPF